MAQHNAMTPPGDDPRRAGRGLGLATRVQVAAHSFMARRADLGLTRRRVRMETDPGRRESMAIIGSITLTAVICLAALFWSFLRPAGSAGQASIIADQKTGALYVRVGETLYPALNLASARLIAGQADNPVRVRRSEIDAMARGPLVGIPGAPSMLDATSPSASSWLVCDAVTKTNGIGAPEPMTVTVIDGQPELSERRKTLQPNDALLLRYDNSVWLIREGRRSRVDPAQRPVLLALGVSDSALAEARTMSQALFDAIPVGPALSVPAIPGAGSPAGFPGAPGPVGTVVTTPQVGGQTTYSVVLATGMQQVTPIVAQILENSNRPGTSVPVLAGPQLSALPAADTLDVSGYPDATLNIVDNQENPATCWWWKRPTGRISRASTSSRDRRFRYPKIRSVKRWSWSTPNAAPPRPTRSSSLPTTPTTSSRLAMTRPPPARRRCGGSRTPGPDSVYRATRKPCGRWVSARHRSRPRGRCCDCLRRDRR